jgi:hypothetical protein
MGSRTRLEWGRFNQQLPVYRALKWLQENHDYDWFVLISGQDYPIQPLAKVEAFLGASPYDGFVESRSMRESSWLIGSHRYMYQYFELPKFPGWGRVKRWVTIHANAMRARGREPRVLVPGGRIRASSSAPDLRSARLTTTTAATQARPGGRSNPAAPPRSCTRGNAGLTCGGTMSGRSSA